MLDFLVNIIGEQAIYAIAWTVIHTFWQASLVALIMSFLLHKYQHYSPSWRYRMALGSLMTVLVAALVTFSFYFGESSEIATSEISTINLGAQILGITSDEGGIGQMLLQFFDEHLLFITNMWILGVVVFLLRYMGSYIYVRQLQNVRPQASSNLKQFLREIKNRMGISRKVGIIETARVKAPVVIGHLKPVILFPIGVINSLSPEEVSAIIAHELAHIIRNDFLINLIQSFAEVLFYYHPAVWWISANIKAEREQCCDQMAIQYSGDAISYAKTLVKLKELQSHRMPALAIPLFNNKKQLLIRIQKILNMQQTKNNIKEKVLAMTFLFVAVLLLSTQANGNNETNTLSDDVVMKMEFVKRPASISTMLPQIDTLPETKQRQSYHIVKSDDEKEVSLKMEDGDIKELKIDGKVIPQSEYDEHGDIIKELKPRRNGNIFMFGDGTEDIHLLEDMDHFKSLKNYDLAFPEGFENSFVFPDGNDFIHIELDSLLAKQGDNIFFSDSIYGLIAGGKNWTELQEKFGAQSEEMKKLMERLGEHDGPNIWHFDSEEDSHFPWRFQQDDVQPEYEYLMPHTSRKGNLERAIGDALNRDRLLEKDKMNKVELTGKHLKINGDKQPKNIWMKYKEIFEEETGIELSKNSKLQFEVKGERKRRKVHAF